MSGPTCPTCGTRGVYCNCAVCMHGEEPRHPLPYCEECRKEFTPLPPPFDREPRPPIPDPLVDRLKKELFEGVLK